MNRNSAQVFTRNKLQSSIEKVIIDAGQQKETCKKQAEKLNGNMDGQLNGSSLKRGKGTENSRRRKPSGKREDTFV